jgi:dipeptidyl aminopeptidase/acylaminoacyl peptidase
LPLEGGPKVRIDSAAYDAEGKRAFAAVQGDGVPSRLYALGRHGAEVAHYDETIVPTASIGDLAVAPTGDRVALLIDAGHHSEIRLLDAKKLTLLKKVDMPLGAAGISNFRADGKQLGVTISTPNAPGDVFALDVESGTTRKLRTEARKGLDAAPIAASITSLQSFDGLVVPVNVYAPVLAGAGKHPVAVMVHGGPSSSAHISFAPSVRFFVTHGFVVVEPNIRGSTGFGRAYMMADDKEKRGDALKDLEAVNRWARAQAFCDPTKMVVMGGSYGGYMTLLALTRQPDLWSAGIDVSGMSDLRTMELHEDQTIRDFDDTEFGKIGRDDAVLAEWSPLKDVDKIVAPLFVYQGSNDPITPQAEADQMVAALRRRHMPVEYMLLTNEGHGVVRRENRIEYITRAFRFLESHHLAL